MLPGASDCTTPGAINRNRGLSLSEPWFWYMAPTCARGPLEVFATSTTMVGRHTFPDR